MKPIKNLRRTRNSKLEQAKENMRQEVSWRLEFAGKLNERLAAFQGLGGIQAVAVGGSVARGLSDVYSDLELILLWENTPDTPTQQAVMIALGATYQHPASHPAHASAFWVQGVPVDVWHLTRAVEEATLRRVLEEYSLDLAASNRLDTFHNCIPFYGHDLLDEWKARLENYPGELTEHFLRVYLPDFHLRHLYTATRRDNPTAYYHTLTDVQCTLFVVLLALNHVYFPTFKWMYPVLETLQVGPQDTAARMRRMFEVPPPQAAELLNGVLAETLSIVEKHYPQIDTGAVRDSLDQKPQPIYPPQSAFHS